MAYMDNQHSCERKQNTYGMVIFIENGQILYKWTHKQRSIFKIIILCRISVSLTEISIKYLVDVEKETNDANI